MRSARFLNRRYLVLAVAIPALLTLTMASAARADSHGSSNPPPACPSATFCTYQNANYNANGGNWWYYSYNSHSNGLWFYVGNAANDQISSFHNSRAWVTWYDLACPASMNVGWGDIAGGASEPNLGTLGGGGNNDGISSLGFATNSGVHWPAHGQC
jgi:Peptidase inhibitor family I36